MFSFFKSKSPSEQPPSASSPSPPQQAQQTPSAPSNPQSQSQTESQTDVQSQSQPETLWQSLSNQRSRKQLSLFFLGASLLCFTSVYTRRAMMVRHRAMYPLFFRPSNIPSDVPVNPAVEAFQALSIASFQVGSWSVMLGGGLFWAFDISTVNDLRQRVREGIGIQPQGKGPREVEQEFEEWLAETLQRREEKKKLLDSGEMSEAEAAVKAQEVMNTRQKGRGR